MPFGESIQVTQPFRAGASRDLRNDWLRGLAMVCVIVNHSKIGSLLSWFSYERFWVVTAAEVFVLLSGIVLGMVYGRRLARDGWLVVVRGLTRRALLLYAVFVGVTVSILAMSALGIDVASVSAWDERAAAWFLDPWTMNAAAWRDIVLMRYGPWSLEIVGLYVWLLLAAVPCLLALRAAGWRPLVAASWAIYLWFRATPHLLTNAEFEVIFPILAWQLLFVHGLVVGYHREQVAAFAARLPKAVPIAAAAAAVLFMVFALCNPWSYGPAWLHWSIVSPDRFTDLYARYFQLTELGFGRLLNLAVAMPLGYLLLGWFWPIANRLQFVFVTLGQRSLGAFALHVYGMLLLAHLPHRNNVWLNTLLQVALIVAIAAALHGVRRARVARREAMPAPERRLAA